MNSLTTFTISKNNISKLTEKYCQCTTYSFSSNHVIAHPFRSDLFNFHAGQIRLSQKKIIGISIIFLSLPILEIALTNYPRFENQTHDTEKTHEYSHCRIYHEKKKGKIIISPRKIF